MAVESVLEAACGIQEVYSLPEVSLPDNVTGSFFFFFFTFITVRKNGNPLNS